MRAVGQKDGLGRGVCSWRGDEVHVAAREQDMRGMSVEIHSMERCERPDWHKKTTPEEKRHKIVSEDAGEQIV